MSDLISRETLKICKHSNGYGYCSLCDQYCVEGPCKDEVLIEYAPVVYCKDCKNFGYNFENETYCKSVNGLADPEEYDFCSYSERKEDADNG